MPATPIATSTRFYAPEITKVVWIPTIAATTLVPTRTEINAGKEMSGEIADLSGFMVTSGTIDTPDLGSRFTGKVGGRTSAGDSSITFHGSRDGNDIRKVLTRDLPGYLWFADGGDVAGYFADLFPVSVLSVGKLRTVSDKNFQLTIQFAISRKPLEDIVIPAQA